MKPIRVVVADDEPLMRYALRTCLEAADDVTVAGAAVDGLDLLAVASRVRPDVVLTDLRMPRLDGVEASRRLVADGSGLPKVIALTSFDSEEYLLRAVRAGVSGFLLKDATPEELLAAVRVVAAGGAVLSPGTTRLLLERLAHSAVDLPGPEEARVTGALTPREQEVLHWVARGMGNIEIARRLHVAPSSVKTHIGHLLSKLGVCDRIQLVIFAYETGLVRPGVRDPA